MPTERDHHASQEKRYEFVVIPEGKTGSTHSVKASVMTIAFVCVGVVGIIIGLTIVLIAYTPAGAYIPISEEQLQKRYGVELFDVQQRLNKVTSEVLVLREYNNKLRKVLGQKESKIDTSLDFLNINSYSNKLDASESEQIEQKEKNNNRENASPSTEQSNIQSKTYRSENKGMNEATFHIEFPIIVPAVGYVSRRYEPGSNHLGIDYAGKIGSLVVAAASGYVIFSGYTVDDGNVLMLSHGDGYITVYKHNQTVLKSNGEFVERGQPIALLGNSGRTSYGPHLHFELWKDGQPKNPDEYLIASKL